MPANGSITTRRFREAPFSSATPFRDCGEPAYDADPILDLDQTPAFDPTEPEAIPDYDFDQTRGA
jgi:hypothetical protein